MRQKLLLRFLKGVEGVSMISATLVFLPLISLLFGLAEFKDAFIVNKRLENASSAVAQIVSSVDETSRAELNQLQAVAEEYLKPFINRAGNTQRPAIIITSVSIDDDDTQIVDWTHSPNNKSTPPYSKGGVFPKSIVENDQFNENDTNRNFIFVEIAYNYESPIGFFITGNREFTNTYSVPVRQSAVTLSDG